MKGVAMEMLMASEEAMEPNARKVRDAWPGELLALALDGCCNESQNFFNTFSGLVIHFLLMGSCLMIDVHPVPSLFHSCLYISEAADSLGNPGGQDANAPRGPLVGFETSQGEGGAVFEQNGWEFTGLSA